MRQFVIGNHVVGEESDCFVIAEIGHNHQGDLQKAKELIRQAKACGVNAVKLQKRDNKSLYTRELYDKPYENENSFGRTYGEHREFLEFGKTEYQELKRFCDQLDIIFFATVFDFASADFLEEIGVAAYKIASGDLANLPLIKYVAGFRKPIFVSTGASTLQDVQRAYDVILPINRQLCIMQCTASYPTQPEDLHLKVIETFRKCFPDIVIGFSDHYNGIVMATAAYVLGARVIEKHFTLNHTWKGTDHALSLEPIGMQKMVRDLKRLKAALGNHEKKILSVELPNRVKMGKKLVAGAALAKGHILRPSDIVIKSPGDGLPPYQIEMVIGKRLLKALNTDDAICLDDLDDDATIERSIHEFTRQ